MRAPTEVDLARPSAEADILGIITEVQNQPRVTNGDEGAGEQISMAQIEETPDKNAGSRIT